MNKRFSVLALSAAVLLGGALAPVSAGAEETGSAAQPVLLARDSRSELTDRIADYLNLSKEQRMRAQSLFNDYDSRMYRHGSDNDRLYDGILTSEQRERLRRNQSITLTPEQIRAFDSRSSDYDRISDSEFNSFRNRISPYLTDEQRRRLNDMRYTDWRGNYSESYSRYGNGRYRDYFSGRRDSDRRDRDYDRYDEGVPRTHGGAIGRTRYDSIRKTDGDRRYDYDRDDRYERSYKDRYDRDRYDRDDRDRYDWERYKDKNSKERRNWERYKDKVEKDRRDWERRKEKEDKIRRDWDRRKDKDSKDRANWDSRKDRDDKIRRDWDRRKDKDSKDRANWDSRKEKEDKIRRDWDRRKEKDDKARANWDRSKNRDGKDRRGGDRGKRKDGRGDKD